MRISDWSSDVCSSDLGSRPWLCPTVRRGGCRHAGARPLDNEGNGMRVPRGPGPKSGRKPRSEEHTSELQSLMRISYAVFCFKKNIINALTSTTNCIIFNTKQQETSKIVQVCYK